jgi:hypothetical protein
MSAQVDEMTADLAIDGLAAFFRHLAARPRSGACRLSPASTTGLPMRPSVMIYRVDAGVREVARRRRVTVRIAGTICARRELTCGRPHGSLLVSGAARRAAAWVSFGNTHSV